MTNQRRHSAETAAFVSLANSLADGYDSVDLFSGLTAHCGDLLGVASAGLLLADGHGVLHLMAASSEKTRDLELYQLQRAEGPCLDCYHAGAPVLVADLAREEERWPQFAPAAIAAGFASVHALPMRLREVVLGTLGLFGARPGALDEEDLAVGQALAHIASIALVAERASLDPVTISTQLEATLRSRVVLEQARGLLAEQGDLDLGAALSVLRRYARDHNQRLPALAAQVVAGDVPAQRLLDHVQAKTAGR